MEYRSVYFKLIERAKKRSLKCYTERHHIIPRCLGGNNKKENIVKLTAREHYIAHLLLIKIHPNNHSIVKAAMMMCVNAKNQKRKMTNRIYGWLREKYSKQRSLLYRGKKCTTYNTCFVFNVDKKQSKRIKKEQLQQYLNKGWLKGRVINFKTKYIVCSICKKEVFHKHYRNKITFKTFCSKKCRDVYRRKNSNIYNIINQNKKVIIKMYKDKISINKICKKIGFPGAMGEYYNAIKNILPAPGRDRTYINPIMR